MSDFSQALQQIRQAHADTIELIRKWKALLTSDDPVSFEFTDGLILNMESIKSIQEKYSLILASYQTEINSLKTRVTALETTIGGIGFEVQKTIKNDLDLKEYAVVLFDAKTFADVNDGTNNSKPEFYEKVSGLNIISQYIKPLNQLRLSVDLYLSEIGTSSTIKLIILRIPNKHFKTKSGIPNATEGKVIIRDAITGEFIVEQYCSFSKSKHIDTGSGLLWDSSTNNVMLSIGNNNIFQGNWGTTSTLFGMTTGRTYKMFVEFTFNEEGV